MLLHDSHSPNRQTHAKDTLHRSTLTPFGMPAQKRALSATDDDPDVGLGGGDVDVGLRDLGAELHDIPDISSAVGEEDNNDDEKKDVAPMVPSPRREDNRDSDQDHGSLSSSSTVKDEYVEIKLVDIRKEVQCPICLGIIRKTRTVMECLHRFCRECIDKSMRLGNKECPACRTHCPSRRSLRDDPNYDSLIAALYPDIDKYEQEEMAFHEEESNRNKKIQASIAETLRRQTEALGKRRSGTSNKVGRKSGVFRRCGSRSFSRGDIGVQGLNDDDDDADVVIEGGGKDSSSTDDRCLEPRPKRFKRGPVPPPQRMSPAISAMGGGGGGASSADHGAGGFEENDDSGSRGDTSGRSGNRDVLVWGKGGARSQTRHGNNTSVNGSKNTKASRITKLVDHLRNFDNKEDELDFHLNLVPLDKTTVPGLERPYICCRPTLSIRHIRQFIAVQTRLHAEEIEILGRKLRNVNAPGLEHGLEEELHVLEEQESLSGLHAFFSYTPGNLVLVYRSKK